jgi:hypothetical protein
VKQFHSAWNHLLVASLLGSCRPMLSRFQIKRFSDAEFCELSCDSSALTAHFLIASRDKARKITSDRVQYFTRRAA